MIGQNLILGQKSQTIAAFSRHRPVAFFFFFSLLMSKGENRLSRMQLETSVKYPRLLHNLLRRLMDGSTETECIFLKNSNV